MSQRLPGWSLIGLLLLAVVAGWQSLPAGAAEQRATRPARATGPAELPGTEKQAPPSRTPRARQEAPVGRGADKARPAGLAGRDAGREASDRRQAPLALPSDSEMSTDVPKTIPDVDGTGINSTLSLSGLAGEIVDIDVVALDISHEAIGELRVELTSPSGTTIELFDGICGDEDNLTNITFDDSAPLVIGQECPPLSGGSYQPEWDWLFYFDGEDPNGTWTLTVADMASGGTPGTLNSWGIAVVAGGSPSTYSNSTPMPIPDTNYWGVESTITVPENAGVVADVYVSGLRIDHPYIADLRVQLTSPSGTKVTLFDQVWCEEADIDNITIADNTPAIMGDDCPPIPGERYQPDYDYMFYFNGEPAGGTWTLTATDVDFFGDDSGGTLQSWNLVLVLDPGGTPTGPAPTELGHYFDLAGGNSSGYVYGVEHSSLDYGDFDRDGHLDLLATGLDEFGERSTIVYRNTGRDWADEWSFEDQFIEMEQVAYGAAVWGDYDNDGDLDILLTGSGVPIDGDEPGPTSKIYRNDGPYVDPCGCTVYAFADALADLTPLEGSAAAWADYDNDGDLDATLAGLTWDAVPFLGVYGNQGDGSFVEQALDLSAMAGDVPDSTGDYAGMARIEWGDFDKDGDLDLLFVGYNADHGFTTRVYNNDGAGGLTPTKPGLPGVAFGDVAAGDYDGDGDLDVAIGGCDPGDSLDCSAFTRVYKNANGAFTLAASFDVLPDTGAVEGLQDPALAWGDYDNDGRLDLAASGAVGYSGGEPSLQAFLFHNEGGDNFVNYPGEPFYALPDPGAADYGSIAWADIDDDGDLDLTLAGRGNVDGAVEGIMLIYENVNTIHNKPPAAPSGLASGAGTDGVMTLSWTAPADDTTAGAALGYNLRVGTTPGGIQTMAPMAFTAVPSDGLRLLAARGNADQRTSWRLELTRGETYYWSVQAIDAAFAGGPFAAEASFTVPLLEEVSWIDLVGVTAEGNSITRLATGPSAWGYGATSGRAIDSSTGYVEAGIGALTDIAAFGLGNGNDDQTANDIDFGFYFIPGRSSVEIAEKGRKVCCASAIPYSTADVFRVAIELDGATPVVRYYKGATLLYTNSKPALNYPLRLDTALYTPGAAIKAAMIGGADLVTVDPRTLTGPPGTCQNVTWTNVLPLNQLSVVNGPGSAASIQRTSGTGWNAGASSVQSFASGGVPGAAEATIGSAGGYVVFGLSKGDDSQSNTDVDYAFYAYPPTRLLQVLYRGAVVKSVGDFSLDDVLRVEFSGGSKLTFYRNDVPLLVATMPAGSDNFPALVDTSLYNAGARLDGVKLCSSSGGTRPVDANVPQVEFAERKAQLLNVSFGDVRQGDYFYDAVQYLGSRGIVSGYGDGTFRPYANTTRAQLAKMVVSAVGLQLENPAEPTFSDVSRSNPFYQFVETAVALRMVSGYSDGTFRPYNEVTRGQLAKMVVLGMTIPLEVGQQGHFSDVSASNPFYQYVETAYNRGLISGYADGSFKPGANATRGQIAKIVHSAVTGGR